MKAALIQSPAILGDLQKNFLIASRSIAHAAQLGAEIFVFPEMSLTGYFDQPEQMGMSVGLSDPFVQRMVGLSANGRTILFGISQRDGSDACIAQLIAQDGILIGTYKKHNLAGDEAAQYKRGDSTPTFTANDHTFGVTICADIDIESLYKTYKDKGCDIVFECAPPDLWGDSSDRNWSKGYAWWRSNCIEKIGRYARDNRMKIAVATMSGRNEYGDFPGGGYLFDEDGKLVEETSDHTDEILIIDI